MVAEGTGKLRVQITRHLLLRRGLSFGLAATHCTQSEASLCAKEAKNTNKKKIYIYKAA